MDNEELIQNLHHAIIEKAATKLGRALTEEEMRFITSRGSLIALEAIMDLVEDFPKLRLENYLNAE